VLVGVHAHQLVVVLGGHDDLATAAERLSDEFGPGPVVTGPVVDGLSRAAESAAAALAGLRRRCAEAMRPALPEPAACADGALLTEALLGALRFRAFPDAAPALRALRAAGLRTVVLSNWDASLHERLAETGLAALVDGAVASAELGAAKPQPEAFAAALAVAGARAQDAWHVGDSPDADVAGALAAGLRAVLIARAGDPPERPPGVPLIRSLEDLPRTLMLAP
jgi:putative hydrolase of the HAD superfamily